MAGRTKPDIVVVIRDGVVDQVISEDPDAVVSIINFGLGERGDYHEVKQYTYPDHEWDPYEVKEIIDEYNQRFEKGV